MTNFFQSGGNLVLKLFSSIEIFCSLKIDLLYSISNQLYTSKN